MEKIAVILLETYSAKLYIAAADQENYFILQAFQKEAIKLSLSDDNDHFLKKPQIDQTINVLKSFRKVCELNDVTKTFAIANVLFQSNNARLKCILQLFGAKCKGKFQKIL